MMPLPFVPDHRLHPRFVLGINAFCHDTAACLLTNDGETVAAVEEERFSRVKRERRFPTESIGFCLREGGVPIDQVDRIAFPWDWRLLLRDRIIRSQVLDYRVGPAIIMEALRRVWSILTLRRVVEMIFGR